MTAEVALGHVGLVLGIEVSRLSRSNTDWYRLLDLCGITDTLVGDADGLYHPGTFNDRLLLGLKGTLAEAELHVLRARLDGGIRNKAQRGELRRGLPIGFVWGEELHRWLADGFVGGEQLSPGAPWRIRMTDELQAAFVDERRRPAGSPCSRPPWRSASPDRRCCSVYSS